MHVVLGGSGSSVSQQPRHFGESGLDTYTNRVDRFALIPMIFPSWDMHF